MSTATASIESVKAGSVTAGGMSRIGAVPAPADEGPRDHVVDIYQYAARSGALDAGSMETVARQLGLPVSEVFSAVTRLVELRLLRTDGAAGDRLTVTDPQIAASLVVSPIERQIYAQRELADRLRERIETISRPSDGVAQPISAIDTFVGTAEISGLLKLAAENCADELVMLRPSGGESDDLDRLFDGCLAASTGRPSVRLIYPHRSRASFASRADAKRLVEAGAQIRTVSHVPQACVVVDRSFAIVLGTLDNGEVRSACRVRDRNIVRCLVDIFDQLWEGAALFASNEIGYAEDVTDELQRRIVRMMAQGLTDEVVARRLGMSVRTCRRHIAALLRDLDSVSRFQAGVQAARRLATENALGA